MTTHMVTVASSGTVRVEILGEGRAINMPASYIIALHDVLGFCALEECDLAIDRVEDDETEELGWQANVECNEYGDVCANPWAALQSLADRIGRQG